jgi:hypothetical protein
MTIRLKIALEGLRIAEGAVEIARNEVQAALEAQPPSIRIGGRTFPLQGIQTIVVGHHCEVVDCQECPPDDVTQEDIDRMFGAKYAATGDLCDICGNECCPTCGLCGH